MTRSTSNQSASASASASSYAASWFPCCGVHYEVLGSGTLACLHNIIAISVYRTAVDNRLTTGEPERILKLVILLLGISKLHRHEDDDDDDDDESRAEYEAV
jgi:hypothetical protein